MFVKRSLWPLSLVAALASWQCTEDDTGAACGTLSAGYSTNTVSGETPLVEVVRLGRDPNCLTFNCLAHRGLPPYCTKSCNPNVKSDAKPTACSTDRDCKAPLACFGGFCRAHDCPQAFWCKPIQEVGPLAGTNYCVRRDCANDFDCQNLGSFSCTTVGCYDACLRTQTQCPFHQLTCEPESSLGCKCADGSSSCGDAALVCQPPGEPQPFPAGQVTQAGICLPKS